MIDALIITGCLSAAVFLTWAMRKIDKGDQP